MAGIDLLYPCNNLGSGAISTSADDISVGGFILPFARLEKTFSGDVTIDISSHSLSEGWVMLYFQAFNDQDADEPILRFSGPASDLFQIVCVDTVASGGSQKVQYWNGSAWTDIATLAANITDGTLRRFDIHWKIADTGGEFTVYIAGASVASLTGDTLFTADTTVDTILCGAIHTFADYANYSPIYLADADTRGCEFWSSAIPVSDGNYTEFTGGEANVDDNLFASGYDSTFAVGDANGERMTLNFNDIHAAFTGYSVALVSVAFAAKAQSEPGLYIKPITRKSATDYSPTGSFQPGSTAIETFAYTMITDPATGSAWDQTGVNGTEFGVKISSTA